MRLTKVQIGIIMVIALVIASIAFAWHGAWTFVESCTTAGKIDVMATYTASDNLGGTVQYTSPHVNLDVGAVVTANLVEDNAQASTYTVVNINECAPPTPPPPTPTPPPVAACPVKIISGFDVHNAIKQDGQLELVWNTDNSISGVNIRYGKTLGVWTHQFNSANDGFEAIKGLTNGQHYWFGIQAEICGQWSKSIDPLP